MLNTRVLRKQWMKSAIDSNQVKAQFCYSRSRGFRRADCSALRNRAVHCTQSACPHWTACHRRNSESTKTITYSKPIIRLYCLPIAPFNIHLVALKVFTAKIIQTSYKTLWLAKVSRDKPFIIVISKDKWLWKENTLYWTFKIRSISRYIFDPLIVQKRKKISQQYGNSERTEYCDKYIIIPFANSKIIRRVIT